MPEDVPAPAVPWPPPAHTLPLPAARPAAEGVRVIAGVAYAEIPRIRPLELDLYLPAEASALVPVVVFLHGGGWQLGSRHSAGPPYAEWSPNPFERVAQAGIAVASVDYRLTGEAQWPAQLYDAKAAVRWLRARSDEIGIDATRIAAWGESAGGHLAELLGLTGADLDGETGIVGPSSAVVAVAAWYAPSDLATVAEDIDSMADDSREALLVGAPLHTVPDRVAQASPLSHVRAGAPPFLLLHGRDDQFIPCSQSERLCDALQQAGNSVELKTYSGADHMWRGAPEVPADALDRTIDFLRRML
ncbi:MAG TPA: alpha/beta hydrolase [Mycobacterium sp.]|nr:alpha/beta hydrolase [Mycobacterium sp.]